MINKHSIYNWLFFPLLTLMLAGSVSSCIKDSAIEEEDTSGKSTLSIKVRGVSQEATSDEYIETLRIIVFDASGLVCNQFYDDDAVSQWEVKKSGSDTYYDIIQELQDFSGGNCRFYFIANEEGYNIYDNDNTTSTSLSNYLGSAELTEEQLKECIIASTLDNEDWSTKPILMIANPSAQYIKPGNDITIDNVELVRCVAKVQLIVQKDNTTENKIPEGDVVTISDVSLHGTRPDSYTLWENGTVIIGSDYSKTLLDGTASSNVGYPDSPYSSDIVYFPEKLYQNNTTEGDLYFTFTLNYTPNGDTTPTVRTYTVAIGKDENNDGTVDDYNIYRNTFYTVTATLKWQPTTPTMNIQVDAWEGKTMNVPPFE